MERRYHMPGEPKAFKAPGQKPVFASNQALRDLEPLKEFGLLSDKTYKLQKRNIQASLEDPFGSVAREEPPSGFVPEGWTGPTTMCRDVTTKVAGLDNEGWAEMNTMKCCNYLCSRTQWLALKDGELQWGLGPNNRYSSAVHTASTAKMADGSDKYLCRSCAWDREPNWKDYGLNGITKMEGHLCPFNTLTGIHKKKIQKGFWPEWYYHNGGALVPTHTDMYIYTYIHVYVYTHVYDVYMYTYTHTYIYMYIYVYKYIHVYIYIHIYRYAHTHTHTHTRTHKTLSQAWHHGRNLATNARSRKASSPPPSRRTRTWQTCLWHTPTRCQEASLSRRPEEFWGLGVQRCRGVRGVER